VTVQDHEAQDGAALDVLLDYLKRTRGFDFTGYKRSSLERRIEKRMHEVEMGSYQEYLDYLEVQSDEFAFLFNTILINVTGFFRDAAAWDYLATEVIPRLLEAANNDRPLRFWCAGCSSGEETYTMAMVLAEALGEQQYLERVKIYATDVDEEALTEARHATYPAKAVEAVPPPLLERYFERVEQRYAFRKELRRTVIFGRNDLVQDAPISRIDLLTCRNTLMYFNAETQASILGRFHFSLNNGGYLYLGKSEMLITHADLFKPVDLKRRVFAKVARPTLRDRLLFTAHPIMSPRSTAPAATSARARSTRRRWRSSRSTPTASWSSPTSWPGRRSACPTPTSGGPSRTSRSPTGPSTCAPTSRAPTPSAAASWSPTSRWPSPRARRASSRSSSPRCTPATGCSARRWPSTT
jgi:chemotaxis methyl-accepting protein methylase